MKKKPLQLDKFKSLARDAECEDDEAAFDKRLSHISKAKVSPPPKSKKKSGGGKRKK